MIRISATLLESFRLFLVSEPDLGEARIEAELIASIKGEQVSNRKMQLGHAFHYLVEHPQMTLHGLYEHSGFRFAPECIESVLERISMGGVFESKAEKCIGETREGDGLVLVAKADHVYGLHLSEFKAPSDGVNANGDKTYASFDAEKYVNSYQWRVMAMLYEPQLITYHVACLKDADECYQLKSFDSMNLYPYAGLESDVKALVREFMRYVRCKGLDGYLRKDDRKAVAI